MSSRSLFAQSFGDGETCSEMLMFDYIMLYYILSYKFFLYSI